MNNQGTLVLFSMTNVPWLLISRNL